MNFKREGGKAGIRRKDQGITRNRTPLLLERKEVQTDLFECSTYDVQAMLLRQLDLKHALVHRICLTWLYNKEDHQRTAISFALTMELVECSGNGTGNRTDRHIFWKTCAFLLVLMTGQRI